MDEQGNVTLEYLYGAPFKYIKLYVSDIYNLSKFEVTSIKIRDHAKIRDNRNFPLFLMVSMIDLAVDYQGTKPNETITISYDKLYNQLVHSLIDALFDTCPVREAVIKI